jgi:hypothetical protein
VSGETTTPAKKQQDHALLSTGRKTITRIHAVDRGLAAEAARSEGAPCRLQRNSCKNLA